MTWNPLRRPYLSSKILFSPTAVDRAEDQQLEALYYKLQHVEETTRRLQKNMKKYLEYLLIQSKAEQRITADLSSSQLCYQNDKLRQVVEDYHTVTAKGCEYIADLSKTCQYCIQEPVKKFLTLFSSVEIAFQHREQLAQDWRNVTAKVRKLEDKEKTGNTIAKLERERKALANASSELISFHSLLLSELRFFLDKRPEFFHPILEAFIRAQLDYHGNMTRLYTFLTKMPTSATGSSPSSYSIPESHYQSKMQEHFQKLKSLSIVKEK